jgi:hypothetical protein
MFEEDVALITCASCEGKKMLLVVSAPGNRFLLSPPTELEFLNILRGLGTE